jgi:hypothetical protein
MFGGEFKASRFKPFGEPGPDTGGSEISNRAAIRRKSQVLVHEQILHQNYVTFDAVDFCHVCESPRSVAEAGNLQN